MLCCLMVVAQRTFGPVGLKRGRVGFPGDFRFCPCATFCASCALGISSLNETGGKCIPTHDRKGTTHFQRNVKKLPKRPVFKFLCPSRLPIPPHARAAQVYSLPPEQL